MTSSFLALATYFDGAGKEIKYGSRFRTTHDFGYVALDITPAYAEDSGTYMCKATNKLGEAVNTGNVNVSCEYFHYNLKLTICRGHQAQTKTKIYCCKK